MKDGTREGEANPTQGDEIPEVANLVEALRLMRADTSNLLKDMLRGISMWGITAVTAFLLAGVSLALSQVILTYAHPYGSLPIVLDILYAGYIFSALSACLGAFQLWRYLSLRKKYSRLFQVADNLR
ncbi:MAG TPA: hypothetical protein VIW22_04925 [Nitrososphaerales archaeon]